MKWENFTTVNAYSTDSEMILTNLMRQWFLVCWHSSFSIYLDIDWLIDINAEERETRDPMVQRNLFVLNCDKPSVVRRDYLELSSGDGREDVFR